MSINLKPVRNFCSVIRICRYQEVPDHELLIAKFRLIFKKVRKTSRPFRYEIHQIPYNYTVEVTNRFKGLDTESLKKYGWRFMTLYRRQ